MDNPAALDEVVEGTGGLEHEAVADARNGNRAADDVGIPLDFATVQGAGVPAEDQAEDMSDEQLEECVNFAKDAFQQPSGQDKVFSAIARNIRMNLDKADPRGTGWNCIVGTKFGAYVTHEIKTYAYFSVAHGKRPAFVSPLLAPALRS